MKLPRQSKPVVRISAPVREAVGLGDLVKSATRKLGFEPCRGCQRRAEVLNRWVTFTPKAGGRR